MTEAEITSQLLSYLRGVNKGVVIKHADQSIIGLPDATVTGDGFTTWVEIKLVKFRKMKPFALKKIVGYLGPQNRLMTQLDLYGQALYVIFFLQESTRTWWTLVLPAKTVAQWCAAGEGDDCIMLDAELYILEGKQFESIWKAIKSRREDAKRLHRNAEGVS